MALQAKKDHDFVTLKASGAVTASANSDAVRLPGMVNGFVFELDLTAAATDVHDLLDVYVQTKVDGTNWLDVVHFAQCTGTGGAKRYIAKIVAGVAQAEFENGTALGAAAVRNILGDEWRVRTVIAGDSGSGASSGASSGSSGDASFTFSVTACPM